MGSIDELASAARLVAEKLGGSVVRVGGGWRGGSGFVIGDGLVLTNAHNVRAGEVPLTFADGRRAVATLRGVDVDGDLAVLGVQTGASAPVEWATAEPELGTAVFGVAAGGGGTRLTVGFVSGVARPFRGPRGRRISGAVEHTAPLAPGSSGSPLAGADGRVVGINTNRIGHGFYLALPTSEAVQARIAALGRGESVARPRLGVGLAPSFAARRMRRAVGLPERDGLLVREVEPNGPAAAAGLQEGDLIVAAAGRELAEPDDLYEVLGTLSTGATLELRVVRGADERAVSVRFVEPEAQPEAEQTEGPVH